MQKASVPNMDQTLKSIGLRLGDERGHNSLQEIVFESSLGFFGGVRGSTILLKGEIFTFEVSIDITQGGTKLSLMYKFVLTLAPCFTKIRGGFQVFDIAAQTMTDAVFWQQ